MKIGKLYQSTYKCVISLYEIEFLNEDCVYTRIFGYLEDDMIVLVLSVNEECFNYTKVLTESGDICWIKNEDVGCLKQVS